MVVQGLIFYEKDPPSIDPVSGLSSLSYPETAKRTGKILEPPYLGMGFDDCFALILEL